MKRAIICLSFMAIVVLVIGQAPQAFNYQAILRNSDGTVKANETVSLQISIVDNNSTSVYLEIHNTQTNDLGLVNLIVGEGVTSDDLSSVDWASGPYFLNITVNGVSLGSSPLLSVPYALYAASGNEGSIGPPGEQGIQGLQGEQGPEGRAGPKGDPGPKGDKGGVGAQGPDGPIGPEGPPGDGDSPWDNATGGIAYNGGYTGIGTSSPHTYLHINGSPILDDGRGQLSLSAPQGNDIWLSFYEDNKYRSYLWYDASAGDLRLQVLSEGDLGLNTAGGNVGVGTSSPTAKLDVNGDLHVRGNITTEDNLDMNELMQEIKLLKDIIGLGTMGDIDGNEYKTVRIGDQVWMAEDLKATHYADGTPLIFIDNETSWANLDIYEKAYCWYADNPDLEDSHGALYNWAAAMNGAESSDANPSGIQGVCPDDWHLPSDSEWQELEMYLGMSELDAGDLMYRGTDQGGKLKDTSEEWDSPNEGATNESGFSALPSGRRHPAGGFSGDISGDLASYWASVGGYYSDEGPMYYGAYFRGLSYSNAYIYRFYYGRNFGFSVRCLRDSP